MTIAQTLKDSDIPFDEVLEQANKIAMDRDKGYELQQVIFKFSDGSQLKAQHFNLYVV